MAFWKKKERLFSIKISAPLYNALGDDWATRFEAHGAYAILIEENDLEKSVDEYRKALILARDHHLDQDKHSAHAVAIQNNNLAWVLWNKCGSEEAILYYGRALDLLESYLFTGIIEKKAALELLQHVGKALMKIYSDTGRVKEAEWLTRRLNENGITMKEK